MYWVDSGWMPEGLPPSLIGSALACAGSILKSAGIGPFKYRGHVSCSFSQKPPLWPPPPLQKPGHANPIQPVALHRIVVTKVQDLAFSLIELHTIVLISLIYTVQVPLQSPPAVQKISFPAQPDFACKLSVQLIPLLILNRPGLVTEPLGTLLVTSCQMDGRTGSGKQLSGVPPDVAEATEGKGESSQFTELKAIQLALDIAK
ncbi:hypothetical protein BTVI_114614 [Pitangus sulphuratus]|nr:hypothetical protein BTVI_114614 [Pitangus sulphuratus]